MNTAVIDIVEQYKRLPAAARKEVLAKLQDVDNEWEAEFDEVDRQLSDVDISMSEIQDEVNAYRFEQKQKARQPLPRHS